MSKVKAFKIVPRKKKVDKTAAIRKIKELQDLTATISDVISRACPTLSDDIELCQFLATELTPSIDSIQSEDDVFNTLEEHIKSFNFNETKQVIKEYCTSIFTDLKELSIITIEEGKAQSNEEDEEEENDKEEDMDEDDGMELPEGACLICERIVPLTKHHVIPKETHNWYRKRGYTKQQLSVGINICRSCHSAIHRFFDNKTLAAEYNTIEALLSHPKVQKWIPYISKKRMFNKCDARTLLPNGNRDIPDSFSDGDD